MKTFKEYEDIDERCDECIFEHEMEGISEAEYQGKKVSLIILLELLMDLKSLQCM